MSLSVDVTWINRFPRLLQEHAKDEGFPKWEVPRNHPSETALQLNPHNFWDGPFEDISMFLAFGCIAATYSKQF